MLAENARIPFDNPTTHLELTDDPRGYDFRIFREKSRNNGMGQLDEINGIFNSTCKSFLPLGIATEFQASNIILGIIVFIIKIFLLAVSVALVESSISKLRLFKVSNMIGIAFAIALVAVIFNLINL